MRKGAVLNGSSVAGGARKTHVELPDADVRYLCGSKKAETNKKHRRHNAPRAEHSNGDCR